MKVLSTLLLFMFAFADISYGQDSGWKPVAGKIQTPWAEKVDPLNPHAEYPRPQLVRGNWKSLNGLWDYAIRPKDDSKPKSYEGKILVPFAVESSLSGVGRNVGKDSVLWYQTRFSVPASMKGKRVILHLGGVDWEAKVSVNGKEAGIHQGGNDPFSFDITSLIKGGGQQDLSIRVWDPTDEGPQPRGKQVRKPEGIWYTPVTGIWQTVWLEAVPETYIQATKQTPDIDKGLVTVSAQVKNLRSGDRVRISAWDGATKVSEQELSSGATASLKIANAKLWSPETPLLI